MISTFETMNLHNSCFSLTQGSVKLIKELKVGVKFNFTLTRFPSLRRDQYYSIGSTRAVDSCGGSIFQDRYVLDLRWVDQVERIVDEIEIIESDTPYILVGGDFNTIDALTRRAVRNSFATQNMVEYTKAVKGTTKPLIPFIGLLSFKLDMIFGRGFSVLDSGKEDQVSASDHYPVWCTLQFEEGR